MSPVFTFDSTVTAEPKICFELKMFQSPHAGFLIDKRWDSDLQVRHLLLHADHAGDGLGHGRAGVCHHRDHG